MNEGGRWLEAAIMFTSMCFNCSLLKKVAVSPEVKVLKVVSKFSVVLELLEQCSNNTWRRHGVVQHGRQLLLHNRNSAFVGSKDTTTPAQ